MSKYNIFFPFVVLASTLVVATVVTFYPSVTQDAIEVIKDVLDI